MDLLIIFKFSVLLQVVITEPVHHQVENRIANGVAVEYDSIRHHGILSYDGQYSCGATIIHHRWGLTAAHCLDATYSYPRFTVGTKYKSGYGGFTYDIDFFIAHPNFIKDDGPPALYINDIGLIHVSSDIQYNENVNFIPVDRDTTANYDNRQALFTGWGAYTIQNGQAQYPSQLLYAVMPIMPISECQPLTDSYLYSDLHICGSNVYRQQGCYGDSGSPLTIDNQLIGIESYGVTSCDGGWPTIFTRVSSFVPWIQSTLASYNDVL